MKKKRIAIVSIWIDKIHGTERCVAEQIERLAKTYELHIYSYYVKDLKTKWIPSREYHKNKHSKSNQSDQSWPASLIIHHKIPEIPGPHILKYVWWFIINHLYRWWDRVIHKLHYDLIFAPGINCFDADLIIAYHVFLEYYQCVKEELRFTRNSLRLWPYIIHRMIFYKIIIFLERIIFADAKIIFGAPSNKTAASLLQYFGNKAFTIYPGIDTSVFNKNARLRHRTEERNKLGIKEEDFVVLFIGNDWKEKGLPCLIQAISLLNDLPICLIVRGKDRQSPYEKMIHQIDLSNNIRFLDPVPDIINLYAVADLYASPSLYDSFAFPPAEAMACGLPVIVSNRAGVFEIITDNHDGIILKDPYDAKDLSNRIRFVYEDIALRNHLSNNAELTAQSYSWERNAQQLCTIIEDIFSKKVLK